jgi:hypothetical protein
MAIRTASATKPSSGILRPFEPGQQRKHPCCIATFAAACPLEAKCSRCRRVSLGQLCELRQPNEVPIWSLRRRSNASRAAMCGLQQPQRAHILGLT